MLRIQTLDEVLTSAEDLPWDQALFVKRGHPWSLDMPCAVLDPNDSPDPDQDPEFAVVNGLGYTLGIQSVQAAVRNARLQNPAIGLPGLLAALVYYFDNDAFLEFGDRQ